MDKYIGLFNKAGLDDSELDYYTEQAAIAIELGYTNPVDYFKSAETISAIKNYTYHTLMEVAINGLNKIQTYIANMYIEKCSCSKEFKPDDEIFAIYGMLFCTPICAYRHLATIDLETVECEGELILARDIGVI